jgi:hypothetical protein
MSNSPPAITDDTPLRLAVAAETAFPGGGMTASGLRKEAAKGRLVVERIAGKDYTTLGAIAKMRKLCQIGPKSTETARTLDADTDRVIFKLKMRTHQAEEDAKLKAAPMTKRERDALEGCFKAKGRFIDTDRYRTIRWLELRGFVEVKFDRFQQAARVTPAGEAEWLRIVESKARN